MKELILSSCSGLLCEIYKSETMAGMTSAAMIELWKEEGELLRTDGIGPVKT